MKRSITCFSHGDDDFFLAAENKVAASHRLRCKPRLAISSDIYIFYF